MSDIKADLQRLKQEILEMPEDKRYEMQPQLGKLIDALEEAGETAPCEIRDLNEELVNDAIEAQFDNMPV